MPRKKNPLTPPKKRGPEKKLEAKLDRTVVLDQKHIGMIAAYRADHPKLTSDSAVIRLAIERLCAPESAETHEELEE